MPWLPLVTSNLPGVASAFYCALDALVAATMLQAWASRVAMNCKRLDTDIDLIANSSRYDCL